MTKTLTSGNDTVSLSIGLNASINGGGLTPLIGLTVDAGAGTDTLIVDQLSTSKFYTVTTADSGVVTLTTASGATSFVDFEKIKFTNITFDLGGTGNDTVTSTSAHGDIMYGFAGNDTLVSGSGPDSMHGGAGNDTYVVHNTSDVIIETANGGTDIVQTSVSFALPAYVENLTLIGSTNASGTGNALNNIIIGNDGANIITGGGGRDVMTGGGGRDTFAFNSIHDTTAVAATRDIITDFTHSVDRIDVSALDANSKVAGNQTFSFQSTAGAHFTGAAGQLHYFYSGANTIVEGDVNGDKVADFQIQLNGHVTLTLGDFVL